jgi:D-isomer specific 2-hydroxyacid dehydrogenase, catalytic domain
MGCGDNVSLMMGMIRLCKADFGGRKVVITETTGLDHIDLEEMKRRGIRVINTPNATMESVSEHALGLVSERNLANCSDRCGRCVLNGEVLVEDFD